VLFTNTPFFVSFFPVYCLSLFSFGTAGAEGAAEDKYAQGSKG